MHFGFAREAEFFSSQASRLEALPTSAETQAVCEPLSPVAAPLLFTSR